MAHSPLLNLVPLTAAVGRMAPGDWTYRLFIPGRWVL